jgi:peptidyl-prolyl cis-trans isomerase SurA
LAGQVGEAEVEISITNASRALGDELKQMLVAGGIPEDKIRLIDNANVKDSVLLALFSRSKKSLELQFNAESALNLSVRSGVFERSDLAFADQLDWKTGYSAAQKNGRFFGVQVYDTLPPGPKDLNEVKGAVISDYQDYLEQKWIDELKAKYQIDYNKKEHKKLYRHYDKKRTAAGR